MLNCLEHSWKNIIFAQKFTTNDNNYGLQNYRNADIFWNVYIYYCFWYVAYYSIKEDRNETRHRAA